MFDRTASHFIILNGRWCVAREPFPGPGEDSREPSGSALPPAQGAVPEDDWDAEAALAAEADADAGEWDLTPEWLAGDEPPPMAVFSDEGLADEIGPGPPPAVTSTTPPPGTTAAPPARVTSPRCAGTIINANKETGGYSNSQNRASWSGGPLQAAPTPPPPPSTRSSRRWVSQRGVTALRFRALRLVGEGAVITGPGDKKATGHVRGRLRASHADREQAVEALKDAFAQGRLDKDELDGRLGQAFASRTYAELAAVTADIPTGSARAEPPLKPVQARARAQVSADVKAGVRAIGAIYLTAGVLWLGAALAGDNGVGGAFVYLAFMVSVVAIFFTLHGTVVLLRSLSDKRPASQGRVHRYTALLCGAPSGPRSP
jgi:hypothetical protein